MAYTQQDRLMAYNIFLETGSIEEVVKRTTIARKTLFRWKKDGGWDNLVQKFKDKVRATLEEKGIEKFVVKDENLLGVGRILFQMAYTSLRPTIEDEEGNTVPNPSLVTPTNISDVITLLTKAMAIQTEVLGKQIEEEPKLDITDEQRSAIYKILLGKRDYYGDEERRKAAEEFRNRQAQPSSEIPS